MNILLIEDEKDLSTSAVMQLEIKGHKVHPVFDIAEAREALDNPEQKYQVVIADHQLPDGQGIHFVEEVREAHPNCSFAIVSGCLVSADIERLESAQIPYFRKPLIYSKVLDELRRKHCMTAPVKSVAEPEDAVAPEASAPDASSEVEPKTSEPREKSGDEPKPKRKKLFGLF